MIDLEGITSRRSSRCFPGVRRWNSRCSLCGATKKPRRVGEAEWSTVGNRSDRRPALRIKGQHGPSATTCAPHGTEGVDDRQAISRTASQGTSDERAKDTPNPAPYRGTKMLEWDRLQQGSPGTPACVLGTRASEKFLPGRPSGRSLQNLAVAGGPQRSLIAGPTLWKRNPWTQAPVSSARCLGRLYQRKSA
jgi:hypothetical protein